MPDIKLVGDGIENVHNAVAMINAAKMFDGNCIFLDRKNLDGDWPDSTAPPDVMSIEELEQVCDLMLALDNHPRARSIFGYQVPSRSRPALIAGNERFGVSKSTLSKANEILAIPMVSRKVNCLNVASASAVALYYLFHRFPGGMAVRNNPQKKRPEVLLIGGSDHVELGSAIRSACAFGWNRVFVEDRNNVWFSGDHGVKREARAAARRAKNEIRVIPTQKEFGYKFERATIVTTKSARTKSTGGTPLHKARLAEGPAQLIVIADEKSHDILDGSYSRFARQVEIAEVEIPGTAYDYFFRLPASIAMAEVFRQVGQKTPWRPAPQEPLYESALQTIAEEQGELISLEELERY